MKKLALCFSLMFLFACEISVNTEMYVSDIIDYMNKKSEKKELFLNCAVDFQISSEDEYNKEPEKYHNMISRIVYEAKEPVITKKDMNTYLSAKGKIYFSKDQNDTENPADKSLIYFTCDEDEKYISIYFNFENSKYNELNYTVKENTFQDIELKDFHIRIEIQNDMAEPREILVYSSYVNNEPVLYNKLFKIDKREKLGIDITTIFKDYTFQNGKQCIMKIVKQTPSSKPEK